MIGIISRLPIPDEWNLAELAPASRWNLAEFEFLCRESGGSAEAAEISEIRVFFAIGAHERLISIP
jgi:hypothetical protein